MEQSVHCYVAGEVAHIENIMARERREKSTKKTTISIPFEFIGRLSEEILNFKKDINVVDLTKLINFSQKKITKHKIATLGTRG